MELKDYQAQALDTFTLWLDALRRAEVKSSAQMSESLDDFPPEAIDLVRDFPRTAWRELSERGDLPSSAGDYVSRTDDAGRPIPHVCFKVPTGGGKTLLGAAALERLSQPTGLVLWIVPSNAIYEQTKAMLWNREHPYRVMLERASGGRVKVLEKEQHLTRQDVENYLCVMLVMLSAANRKKNKEFLRMFRESEKYPSFFPDADDPLREGRLLAAHPDLDRLSMNGPVVQSLANVFKMLRPVIVLDEAHKAYGKTSQTNQEFVQAINRFDPQLVIELSATPAAKISNLLVDIRGPALKREEMIKLPIRVHAVTNADWQHTVGLAIEELKRLDREAVAHVENGGGYIRPIAVVRVERTGKDQRDGDHVHAEDVREHLQKLGVPAEQIAVKTAAVDEITGVDLLSEYSSIRWIITKAAIMEGWDCPFAYLLVMLDNTKAQTAITQLVGRVMRQPDARRTGREALDQCYVYCWNASVSEAMTQVKRGLEREGLGDLSGDVLGDAADLMSVTISRREQFAGQEIFLPKVLYDDGVKCCELDYRCHILSQIDWSQIRVRDPQSSFAQRPSIASGVVDVDETGPTSVESEPEDLNIDTAIRLSWYARRLSDIVPNAWQAARIASDMIRDLVDADQSDEQIYRQRTVLAEFMRSQVSAQIDVQAEQIFRDKLRDGEIRFDLDASVPRHRVNEKAYQIMLPQDATSLERRPGQPLQFSLFEPIINEQFDSELEKRFARYLDEQSALHWWHRISVRQHDEYYLRGWRPERIWPDFIAMAGETNGYPHLLVFETKGNHLAQTDDTKYKEQVLNALEATFNPDLGVEDAPSSYGNVTVRDGPMRGTFRLVFDKGAFDVVETALARP